MTSQPKFLNVSGQEQRTGFREISAYCDKHLTQALEHGSTNSPWSVDAAFDPKNRRRNRYSNVLPWDKTRVPLPVFPLGSDYTNASFVQLNADKYIAAQGPLESTVHHFWAMCFSQAEKMGSQAIFIAMVTPLVEQNREKCCRYWPTKHEVSWDMGKALRAENLGPHDLKVTWLSEEPSNEFLLTKFSLESNGVVKTVHHYYYLGWRDTLTPNSVEPLVILSRRISEAKLADPGLVPVVHCSAGVGRTGTFIAIDHFLKSDLSTTPEKDLVFETVKTLRDHRMMMVQTVHQYCFLYQVARDIYTARKQ